MKNVSILAFGLLLCSMLALTLPQAHARNDSNLLVLGSDLEFPMSDCVARLKADGNIEILSDTGQQCVDVQVTDPVALQIALFEKFPQLDTGLGFEPTDTVYVAWAAKGQGEVTCQQSADPSLTGWSGSADQSGFATIEIPINPASGYDLTLQCQDEESSAPIEESLTLQIDIPPPEVSLTVDPIIQEPGGQIELTWASTNAVSCTALGGADFPDWPTGEGIDLDGSLDVGIPSSIPTDTDYEFRVECENSAGVTSDASAEVQVLDDGLPAFCSDPERQPPEDFEPRTRLLCSGSTSEGWNCSTVPDDGSNTTWQSVWGQEFPRGEKRRIFLPTETYASLEFDSGTFAQHGTVVFEILQAFNSGAADGRPLVSMSECPGDFSDALADEGCRQRQLTSTGSFNWTRSENSNNCQLEPNTRYFLNITYAANEYPVEWSCGNDTACGNNSQPNYVE